MYNSVTGYQPKFMLFEPPKIQLKSTLARFEKNLVQIISFFCVYSHVVVVINGVTGCTVVLYLSCVTV